MEWGAHIDKLPPEAKTLDRRPVLLPGLDFYFTAFQELQSERPIGMAAGCIPWSSIINWAAFHGLDDPDEVDTLITYTRAMESTMRQHEERKNNDG